MLPRSEVLDRLIANRILVKLSGPEEQVLPVLNALDELSGKGDFEKLVRFHGRLKLARKQISMGFISPWQ
jgi:hypothetical protein